MQFMVWVVSVLSIGCADANDIPHFHNSCSGATCESKNNDSGLGRKQDLTHVLGRSLFTVKAILLRRKCRF
jgi:hypothetical protein